MDEVQAPLFPGLTTGQHYSSLFDKDYSRLPPPPPPPPSVDLAPGPACGFMELLGHQSFESFSSLLDGMISDHMTTPTILGPWNCFKGGGGGGGGALSNGESVTTPTAYNTSSGFLEASTPNSSSISSASNDELQAVLDPDDTHVKEEEDLYLDQDLDQDQDPPNNTCTKMPLKPKKTNQKKKKQQREKKEARFAFMTKSEVDHLEDGYRWRKYGQKAVKNSPFPRSYYRCTNASCNVKKRVERCFNDPSIVITTYEGQHTHLSPNMARSVGFPVTRFLTDPAPTTAPCALPDQRGSSAPTLSSYSLLHGNYYGNGSSTTLNFNQSSSTSAPAFQSSLVQGRRFCNPSGGAVSRENGLLQDIVPSHVYDAK